jgi:hypothetical protein
MEKLPCQARWTIQTAGASDICLVGSGEDQEDIHSRACMRNQDHTACRG